MKIRTKQLIAVLILAGMLLTALTNVRMPLANAASQTSINTAIQKGLVYLNSTQASDGSWSSGGYPVACTAMAVLAFENKGHYGWNATDPYNNTVQKGLNWLFAHGSNQTLTNKTAGNPDVSGTGIGVYWPSDGEPIYETPMVLMAIVGSNAPTNVTSGATAATLGVRTYHAIVQDIVDYLAWAQNDVGQPGRGGWRYTAEYGTSDNSVSQWAVVGLMAAALWGIKPPAFVKSELNYWIKADQDLTGNSTSNSQYGSFGYTGADSILGGIVETAAGIAELTYVGAPSNNASIIAAEGYINTMWTTNNGGWQDNLGELYCMYGVMKAMREANPPIQYIRYYNDTPGVEWYNGTGEYADALVTNQSSTGSWTNWVSWYEDLPTDLSTAFGVLILEFIPVSISYSLTVTVLDATTSKPIAGAAVTAVGPGSYSGTTGKSGQVVFSSVYAGTYLVNASASGYSLSGTTVSVTSNTAVTIKLSPTALAVGGTVEPVNTLEVLLAGIQVVFSEYWVAFLVVTAFLAALIIFKKRRE
ncbi:MAG: carboxypeptidase regulatory-like domain-containing protein [Nitrososphaeria archaeon]|jgi:hypothetical protein